MKTIAFIFTLFSFASAAAIGDSLRLVPAELAAFAFVSDGPQQARAAVVPAAGQPFENAWRIDVLTQPPNPWKVQLVTRTRGRFTDWDVINEPFAHRDLMEILGDEVMVEWFKAAREADPEVKLLIEEGGKPRKAEVVLDKSWPSAVVHSHPTSN
jgi:hypothetical protein